MRRKDISSWLVARVGWILSFLLGAASRIGMAPHVVICDAKTASGDDLEAQVLTEYGVEASYTTARTESEAIEAIGDAEGVIVDSLVPMTSAVLEAAPSLSVVARAGIGVDNVDLAAAEELGVTVLHHPTYSIDEVATHALSLALTAVRKLPMLERDARLSETTVGDSESIRRLSDQTFGIIGFGNIGRRFATMIQGFGCSVLAFDPYVDENVVRSHNVQPVSFEHVLAESDILSVHAPLTEETAGMIDASAIASMKDEAILVNTGRGGVVDTESVVVALEEESLGFACLDVTQPEPLDPDHRLFELDHAIITPHMAWYSDESRIQLRREVAADVGRTLADAEPRNPVTTDMPWV